MRSLLVLVVMVMMEAAEAQVLLDHQMTPLYTSDQGPLDPHVLEKRVLEEQVLEDELTHLEEISHPPVVNQDHQWQKEVTEDNYPKKYRPVEEDTEKIHHTTRMESYHSKEILRHRWEEVSSDNVPGETHHVTESSFDKTTMPFTGTGRQGEDVEPTVGTECNPEMEVMQEPVVLPVTEGKNNGQDTMTHYGLPKELMPIHPGGGSRFEDLEKEKLERAKMAQTKADDGDTDNGTSHDAESLYSSSTSLCLSSLIISFSSLRILI